MEDNGRDSQSLVLGDGRTLGFAEWGDPDGDLVVVDFHGGPGCRLSTSANPDELAGSGLRWITTDRPGLGLSSPHVGRTVADFADDIRQLLDRLNVDRFVSTGWSMGGPYAAGCAAVLRERVSAVALIAPAPPASMRPGGAERMGKSFAWILARDDPWQMAQLYTSLGLEARRNPQLAVALFSDGLSRSELAAFEDATVRAEFIATIIEATRQGAIGLVDDMRVVLAPWGYDPRTVACPAVLWQGDDDSFVCDADVNGWADTIPHLDVRKHPNEGHLLPLTHTSVLLDIVRQVVS